MPGTRSSARQAAAAGNSSSPASSQAQPKADKKNAAAAGSKRKAGANTASPQAKKGRKGAKKAQATIEETMPTEGGAEEDSKDTEMQDEPQPASAQADASAGAQDKTDEKSNQKESTAAHGGTDEEQKQEVANGEADDQKPDVQTNEQGPEVKESDHAEPNASEEAKGGDAVEESTEREESTPSSILEKGIIYFFFRGRVGIEEPSDVNDIARSYIILRPLPRGAKLGDGPIGDAGHNRMLALPKKVLPVSPKDRFMVFVEKANATMDDIKNSLSASDYMTKTAGSRHTPAAAPIGEGVYAITSTGREAHLAYILTVPSEVSEVQEDIGLRQRGSYLTSAKNPTTAAPAGANLPKGAEYPQEILDEFHGRGWMPLEPKLLDYENTQFLLIGHKEDSLEKATVPQPDDEENGKEAPKEELEKLEHEDGLRVQHLKGDDSVFEDLGLDSKEYPKLQTTW
ncbi:MAG: hypothetical protein Q9207_001060 [Kuettlingeria erythrocarpa]